LVWVEWVKPHSKNLVWQVGAAISVQAALRIYRELFRNISGFCRVSGIPECFVAGRTPNKFAKSNRVPVVLAFAKLTFKRRTAPPLIAVYLFI